MKGHIYSNKLLIGITDFKHTFGSMGHMYGSFKPTENYNAIKSQVQEFCASTIRDFEKWEALRFNVQIENGYFIFPVGGYEIFDYPDYPDEPMEFHIAGVHSHIYEDYFVNKKQFLIEPWQIIDIKQKINLEDELLRQTGLTYLIFSALGKHRFKDNVLFVNHGYNANHFVVANLKVGQTLKIDEVLPAKNYYMEFDDFVRERMTKDNREFRNP